MNKMTITGEYHNSFMALYTVHVSPDVLHTQVLHILLHHGNKKQIDRKDKSNKRL